MTSRKSVAELREWLGNDKISFGGDGIDALYTLLDHVEGVQTEREDPVEYHGPTTDLALRFAKEPRT